LIRSSDNESFDNDHFNRSFYDERNRVAVGRWCNRLAGESGHEDGQPTGSLLNVLVGIVGSVLAGWVISPLVGAGTINQGNFSLPSPVVSFIGAVILLAVVNMFRRGAVR